MIYSDIIKYFERGEVGVTELLTLCQPEFETVEDIKGRLKSYLITDELSLDEALSQLTGIYMHFEPIFQIAQAYKEINEDTALLKFKNDPVPVGEKAPTDTVLKTMAHKEVALYIKIRNAMEAYVHSCEKGISSIQSLRKTNTRDQYKPQG